MARQPIHEGLVVAVIEVIMEAKKLVGLRRDHTVPQTESQEEFLRRANHGVESLVQNPLRVILLKRLNLKETKIQVIRKKLIRNT